jgi:hypothetical protein
MAKFANDPQAASNKEKKDRKKRRDQRDKLASDVAYYGAGAIGGLGGLGISMATESGGGTKGKSKKPKNVSGIMKDYFNSKNKPKYQAPKVGVSRKELGIKGGAGPTGKRLKRI